MTRFHGMIGFSETVEERPGVWVERITERQYRGDILKRSLRVQPSDSLNDDITVSNEISVLCDAYAHVHLGYMRYVMLGGVKWKITAMELRYPRIILTVGGVYNG